MNWLGIDIGGAHLKLATSGGRSAVESFPMWRAPERLPEVLGRLVASLDSNGELGLAVTMTGELADCFADKGVGVRHIAESTRQAAAGRPVKIYAVGGEWYSVEWAIGEPSRVAASNWHALAQYALRDVSHWPAWLIDIGSTTTDIIPLTEQGPAAQGETDWTRMLAGELIYTGVERTPVCAVLDELVVPAADDAHGALFIKSTDRSPIRVGVAAELFATMQDVYVVLGDLAEAADSCHTADGRPLTRSHALQRLSRLLCADRTEIGDRLLLELARQAADAQVQRVSRVMAEMASRRGVPRQVVFGGHGEFLLRRAIERLGWPCTWRRLGEQLTAQLLRAATAYAVACLADEQLCGR